MQRDMSCELYAQLPSRAVDRLECCTRCVANTVAYRFGLGRVCGRLRVGTDHATGRATRRCGLHRLLRWADCMVHGGWRVLLAAVNGMRL